MATTNLSEYDLETVPSAEGMKVGIVVSEWNFEVTGALLQGAINTLVKHGANNDDIIVKTVPGSFELTAGGNFLALYNSLDAVICIGCVIRGGTPHFEYICQGVTQGITDLNLKHNIAFIYGVLTTDNQQQALDRAGGVHGNKGDEAAYTAIKMVALQKELKK